jgi:hypothetical protein
MPKPVPTEADLQHEEDLWWERFANDEIDPADNCHLTGAFLVRLLGRLLAPPRTPRV